MNLKKHYTLENVRKPIARIRKTENAECVVEVGPRSRGKEGLLFRNSFSNEFTSERVLEAVLKQLKSSLEVYNCGDEETARSERTVEKWITQK